MQRKIKDNMHLVNTQFNVHVRDITCSFVVDRF